MAYRKSLQFMVFDFASDLSGVVADDGQYAYCSDSKVFYQYNAVANSWITSNKTTVKKSAVVVVGTTTGNTLIYTIEASTLNFYPITVVFRAVNISGVTLRPTVSVGTNSTTYDNIVTAGLLGTLLGTLTSGQGAPQSASISPAIAGGTGIYARVSIAGLATSYTFNVEIVGFYDN